MRLSNLPLTVVLVCTSIACSENSTPAEPVGIAAATATAAQGQPPSDADQTPFLLAGYCEFDVLGVVGGKEKAIEVPGERTIFIFPGGKLTLTNVENGNQETFNATGPLHVEPLENGDLQLVGTGRSGFAESGAGIFLVIGHAIFVFDPESGVTRLEGSTGLVINLCELLA